MIMRDVRFKIAINYCTMKNFYFVYTVELVYLEH